MTTWGKKSLSKPVLEHVTELAKPRMHVGIEKLDQEKWHLNCKNGTVDLRTAKLLPHDRRDWITVQAPVQYDPDAKCPRFLSFLEETTDGDRDLAAFIQMALGYSLTGSTEEHCCYIAN